LMRPSSSNAAEASCVNEDRPSVNMEPLLLVS
jgi:hypothetical protein